LTKICFKKNIATKKPIGYIIAFSFGKGAIEEVVRLKNKEERVIKLVTVEEIIPIATKPAIGVHINKLLKDEKGSRKIVASWFKVVTRGEEGWEK
jgi:hypothetical protein